MSHGITAVRRDSRSYQESFVSTAEFSSLPLKPALLENIKSLGYTHLTPIQAQSLPYILEGRDVIAQAKTGSGKTAAFGIGLLAKLDLSSVMVQAMVVCPTRELADQVCKEIRRLARFTQNIKVLALCGGVPFGPQLGSLEHGVHVVVGTPGRLQEHLRKRSLGLSNLKVLVLDEADRMLDMGFIPDVKSIVLSTPPKAKRQTMFFSATMSTDVKRLAEALEAQGGTAIYDAVRAAYTAAVARRTADRGADRYYSIVLMTDGENRDGASFADFERWHRSLPPADQGIRVFPILFGEAKPAELEALAQLTGGRVFDGRKSGSLAVVFKEIRSYQ